MTPTELPSYAGECVNIIEFSTRKPIDSAHCAELIPLEITYLVKESGLLTRKIHLAADGTTVIDFNEGRMSRGPLLNAYNSNGSSAFPARK
jgi:hypothetical protein